MDHWVFLHVMHMNWVCMFPNKQIIQNIISSSCCILYSVRTFNRLIIFDPTCTYILFNIISSYHTKICLALVSINHLNFGNTCSLLSFFFFLCIRNILCSSFLFLFFCRKYLRPLGLFYFIRAAFFTINNLSLLFVYFL